jgi:hypothetical protein
MEAHEAVKVFSDNQHHWNRLRQYGYHPKWQHNGDYMTLVLHHESIDPEDQNLSIDTRKHPDKYHRVDNINPMVVQHWLDSRMQLLADIGFDHKQDKHPKKHPEDKRQHPAPHHLL